MVDGWILDDPPSTVDKSGGVIDEDDQDCQHSQRVEIEPLLDRLNFPVTPFCMQSNWRVEPALIISKRWMYQQAVYHWQDYT
jgi:hypothetical protein